MSAGCIDGGAGPRGRAPPDPPLPGWAQFATPVLAVLGVPGLAAVVAPLPALLPGSAVGAWRYSRQDRVD